MAGNDEDVGRYCVVTLQQLSDGYLELNGMIATRHNWRIVRSNGDGTFVVMEPKLPKQSKLNR